MEDKKSDESVNQITYHVKRDDFRDSIIPDEQSNLCRKATVQQIVALEVVPGFRHGGCLLLQVIYFTHQPVRCCVIMYL